MQLSLSTQDYQIILNTPHQTATIEANDAFQEKCKTIAEDYQQCRAIGDYQQSQATLLSVGEQLYQLLPLQQTIIQTWLQDIGSRQLQIIADNNPNALQRLLLNLPWEIMAHNDRFFAEQTQLYEVSRRMGLAHSTLPSADYCDLNLVFMAADPNFDSDLQYEQEEQAILHATQSTKNLNLMVEESGNLDLLTQRIIDSKHCDMVHLSCHGKLDQERGLLLQLEDQHFALQEVSADDFQLLSQHIQCLFLSACHSAEHTQHAALTAKLTSIGIANVVGWDGSVNDADASYFAAQFYQALMTESNVPSALAFAQREALKNNKRHWHLARCYLSPQGGATLINKRQARSPNYRSKNFHVMLDRIKREVKVASKESFVGRRWQTKQALRYLIGNHSEYNKAGVLLYGIGGTGKSSLAARIIDRLAPTYKPVVIYKHYDAPSILTALNRESPQRNYQDLTHWLENIKQYPDAFGDILQDILENVFSDTPIILLLDDLEQHILEPLAPEQEKAVVKPAYRAILIAVIEAFKWANTDSCLLMTSRYPFSLYDDYGDDITADLATIVVPDMNQLEQQKQWLALLTIDKRQARDSTQDQRYLARIFKVCCGNAGLQAVLFAPLLKNEISTLDKVLNKIEAYQASNTKITTATQNQDDLDKYLQRVALGTYSAALSNSERELLRVMTVFDFPIPSEVLIQAAPKLGLANPEKLLKRLDNFGLLNHWQGEGLENHISCFSLARKVVEPLSKADRNFIAVVCVDLLVNIWFKNYDTTLVNLPLNEKLLSNYYGEVYLSGLEHQRIIHLNSFSMQNNILSWEHLNIIELEFFSLLELSLFGNSFKKLAISKMVLKGGCGKEAKFFYNELKYKNNRIKKLSLTNPQLVRMIVLNVFSTNRDLLNMVYKEYFQANSTLKDLRILDSIEVKRQDSKYLAAIELASTTSQKAEAFVFYALFLKNHKKDYWAAEEMYLQAIAMDSIKNSQLDEYIQLLFILGKDILAEETLEKVEKHLNINRAFELQLAFYRYAHCEPYTLKPLKQLLLTGARSLGWDLSDNVKCAQQKGHPQADLVAAIADIITNNQPLEKLNQFPIWRNT